MTDISNLKPGDALTYEQAMALPDGAVWEAYICDTHCVFSGPANKVLNRDGTVFCGLDDKDNWRSDGWHSVRLESLPEPAKPERQASEIEKLAAIALLGHRRSALVFSSANEPIIDLCRHYIEAYDYAKSIGAIE